MEWNGRNIPLIPGTLFGGQMPHSIPLTLSRFPKSNIPIPFQWNNSTRLGPFYSSLLGPISKSYIFEKSLTQLDVLDFGPKSGLEAKLSQSGVQTRTFPISGGRAGFSGGRGRAAQLRVKVGMPAPGGCGRSSCAACAAGSLRRSPAPHTAAIFGEILKMALAGF